MTKKKTWVCKTWRCECEGHRRQSVTQPRCDACHRPMTEVK